MPFEAHLGQEANTVLLDLTKKPSLQNLKWEKRLKQKSACSDSDDSRTSRMPHPTQTNWTERWDAENNVEHINHLRWLGNDQLVRVSGDRSGGNGSKGSKQLKPEGRTNKPNKSTKLSFQRIKHRNQRYKMLNKKVIKEPKHTLNLEKGYVLTKSAVAEKANQSTTVSPKGKYQKPPTMEDVKKKRGQEWLSRSKSMESKVYAQSRQK